MPEIIPAIIAKDFAELEQKIKLVESFIGTVQLDIMDGVFVPNQTWPFGAIAPQDKPFLKELDGLKTSLFLEAHLMVAEPEKVVEEWLASKVGRIIIHYEAIVASVCHAGLDPASRFNQKGLDSGFRQNDNKGAREGKFSNLIRKIHNAGKEIGISLNPETPIEVLEPYTDNLDLVLLMSVNPGFAGQEFQPVVLEKIKSLRQKYPAVKIGVDGGINLSNAREIAMAGADYLAVGSGIWESGKTERIISELEKLVK